MRILHLNNYNIEMPTGCQSDWNQIEIELLDLFYCICIKNIKNNYNNQVLF